MTGSPPSDTGLFAFPRHDVEAAVPMLVEQRWRKACDNYDALRRERSQALYGHPNAHIEGLHPPTLAQAVRDALRDFEAISEANGV